MSKIGVLNISVGIYVVVDGVIVFLCGLNARQKSADLNEIRSNTCIISKNKNKQIFKQLKKPAFWYKMLMFFSILLLFSSGKPNYGPHQEA